MRLRTKILLLSLGITMISLVLQTFLFAGISSKRIYENTKEDSFIRLENMQNEIYLYIRSVENGLIKIYNENDLLQDFGGEMTTEQLQERYYRKTYQLATENFNTSARVMSMYLYTREHQIISTYRKAMTPKHRYPKDIYENAESGNVEVIKQYIDSSEKEMLVTSYYNTYREKDIVRFVIKIYNPRAINQFLGYLVCDVDSQVFLDIMKKYVVQDTEYVWLQNKGDRVVTSYGNITPEEKSDYETAVNERWEINQNQYEKQDGQARQVTYEYDGRVFFEVPQRDYQLNAYLLMSQSLIRENQIALMQSLLLITLAMGIASVVIAIYVSNALTRPLVSLVHTMKQIKEGDTRRRAEIFGQVEIKEVSEGLNEMLDRLEDLIGREYEQQLLINQAEYKALQAQINPHFLYNTLDTMGSIANLANCPQVGRLCQALSGMFRYSLDMQNPYSTVAKELGHLNNYIYIMNVRMNSEVAYDFEIDEDIMQKRVPKIVLQPIVENALLHGLKNKRGEKWIRIRLQETEGSLVIEVEDNGVGTDAEVLNRKLQENRKEDVEKGKSIGLSNINARLKMIYGQEYGITVYSKPEEGTTVVLRLSDID